MYVSALLQAAGWETRHNGIVFVNQSFIRASVPQSKSRNSSLAAEEMGVCYQPPVSTWRRASLAPTVLMLENHRSAPDDGWPVHHQVLTCGSHRTHKSPPADGWPVHLCVSPGASGKATRVHSAVCSTQGRSLQSQLVLQEQSWCLSS